MKTLMVGLLIGALMGAAQAGDFTVAQCGPFPKNYKTLAKTGLNRVLKDPDSAKIRFLASPNPGGAFVNHVNVPAWLVMAAVNSKNSYGGYTGEHLFQIAIYRGKVLDVIDATALGF